MNNTDLNTEAQEADKRLIEWIKLKLELTTDASFGDVMGQMHVVCYGYQSYQRHINQTLDAALSARKWTPIAEGLPEEDGEYDITAPGLGGEPTVYIDILWTARGERDWSHFTGVTAWRPRPEPYQPPCELPRARARRSKEKNE